METWNEKPGITFLLSVLRKGNWVGIVFFYILQNKGTKGTKTEMADLFLSGKQVDWPRLDPYREVRLDEN